MSSRIFVTLRYRDEDPIVEEPGAIIIANYASVTEKHIRTEKCTDASDPGHFGPKTLRTYRNSDPGHFGMTEVSPYSSALVHFGTGAEMSYGHFALLRLSCAETFETMPCINHPTGKTKFTLRQGCPTGGPRDASGPRPLLIRPVTTLQRTLFTDVVWLSFSVYCV